MWDVQWRERLVTPQSTTTTTNAWTQQLTVEETEFEARSYFDYKGVLQSAKHKRTLINYLTTKKNSTPTKTLYFDNCFQNSRSQRLSLQCQL